MDVTWNGFVYFTNHQLVEASIHSIWTGWSPRRCRNQSSIYWISGLPTKHLERNERTFLLPLLQQYFTLLLMLNRSAMFTKKDSSLAFFLSPHITHVKDRCISCMPVPGTPKDLEIVSSQTNYDFFTI